MAEQAYQRAPAAGEHTERRGPGPALVVTVVVVAAAAFVAGWRTGRGLGRLTGL